MNVRETAEFRRDVGHILRGRFLVSDRLFDRVEEIAALALEYEPENWPLILETKPELAKAVADSVDELRFIISEVKDHYAQELAHAAEVQAVAGQVTEGGTTR